MVTLLAKSSGTPMQHRRALGGTQVLWKALLNNEIQVYTEYTGTISAEKATTRTPARDFGGPNE